MQRLQQAMQKQAQQGNGKGGMDPKDAAKIQATMMTAKVKSDNMRDSHAQRTAQRQIQFEQQVQQDAQKHQADIQGKDLETAAEITRNRLKSVEPEGE